MRLLVVLVCLLACFSVNAETVLPADFLRSLGLSKANGSYYSSQSVTLLPAQPVQLVRPTSLFAPPPALPLCGIHLQGLPATELDITGTVAKGVQSVFRVPQGRRTQQHLSYGCGA